MSLNIHKTALRKKTPWKGSQFKPSVKASHDSTKQQQNSKASVPSASELGSRTKIKKDIRDLNRFLAKKGATLAPEIKTKKEAELAELKQRLTQKSKAETAKKLRKVYKGVRFVEEQKVLRKLKKLTAKLGTLQAGNPQEADIRTTLDSLKRDLVYIRYFPEDEKYISLYPSGETTESEETNKKREKYRTIAQERYAGDKGGEIGGVDDWEDQANEEKGDNKKNSDFQDALLEADSEDDDEAAQEDKKAVETKPKGKGKGKTKKVGESGDYESNPSSETAANPKKRKVTK